MTNKEAREEAHDELEDVVEDLFYVANLLDRGGELKVSGELVTLAMKVSEARTKLKR